MIDEIQQLLDNYQKWLRDKTTLRRVEQYVEITTPFLDRHNDYLQIYARRENGGFLLTDDGYTLDDLEQSGCKLESPKRRSLLTMTLNGFGVQCEENALQVHAGSENFALRKHNLVQAMLAVNDLFYVAEAQVASLFYEDVVAWLDLHEVRYTEKVKFTGKSGYDHMFDFVIPKSRTQPERILKTVTRPSRDTAEIVAFSWIDTKEVRPPNSRAYAILNDCEHKIAGAVVEALSSYDVVPVLWSKREERIPELAA
jgi:hypothetical protein